MRSKELCVVMMPSHAPLAILAVRSLRRVAGEILLGGDQQSRIGVELHDTRGRIVRACDWARHTGAW